MIGLLLPLLMNNLLGGPAVPTVTFPAVCFDGTASNPEFAGEATAVSFDGTAENPTFAGRVTSCKP